MTHCGTKSFYTVFCLIFLLFAASCSSPDSPTQPTPGAVLPAQVGGKTLEVKAFDGAEIVANSAAWAKALAQIGASASDVSLAISLPDADATTDFQIGALRIANTDWAARLSAFIQAANDGGNVSFTQTTLGGKTVYRGENKATPARARGYYYVAGDTLFFITASNEADASEALSQIADVSANKNLKTSSFDLSSHPLNLKPTDLPPATGILILTTLILPPRPLCVGELENPASRFVFLVTDGNSVPDVMASTTPIAAYGVATPPINIGSLPMFYYRPTTWSNGQGQSVSFLAVSPIHGDTARTDIRPPQLIVFQCVNGSNWNEGEKVIQVQQKGANFTGAQISGPTSCGPPGRTFSGTISANGDSKLSGTVTACNPDVCVNAGFLPRTMSVPLEGVLSDDAKTMSFVWQAPTFDLSTDLGGRLIGCPPLSGTIQRTFILTRPYAEPLSN